MSLFYSHEYSLTQTDCLSHPESWQVFAEASVGTMFPFVPDRLIGSNLDIIRNCEVILKIILAGLRSSDKPARPPFDDIVQDRKGEAYKEKP
jgi:hypothetical protein